MTIPTAIDTLRTVQAELHRQLGKVRGQQEVTFNEALSLLTLAHIKLEGVKP